MQSPFSLLSSTLSPQLRDLQEYINTSSQLFSQLGSLPLLLTELNQNGLSHPESLSMMLQHVLGLPLPEIRLSMWGDNANTTGAFTIWQFDELEGVLTHHVSIEPNLYMPLCQQTNLQTQLRAPQQANAAKLAQALFGSPKGTLLTIPMTYLGQQLGSLHMGKDDEQGYEHRAFFLAQLCGQLLSPIFAHRNQQQQIEALIQQQQQDQQAQQTIQSEELLRAKTLLQETKEALLRMTTAHDKLKQKHNQLEERLETRTQANENLQKQLLQQLEQNNELNARLHNPQPSPTDNPPPKHTEPTTPPMPKPPGPARPQTGPMPVTLPHASGESYVATKPPPVRTVSEGLQSNRPQATLPQTGNLALPSIESLKNAFRPKGGPSPDITSELLLVDVLDEPLSESAEMALDLLDEMEVEQTHPTSPTILCLRDEPPAALRSFARIVQTFSFQLQPANTTQHLLEMLEATQPQAIALSSSQCHTGTRLLQHLQDANGDKRLPLFEADEEEAQGLRIRLRWGPYISPYQKDTFWHAWLQKTKTKDEHRHALLLGLSVAEGKSLTNYFCETTHAKTANNPVDGIQYLYQQPPLLFVVKLEQEPLQWASLFTELAGLYNMKEVPVLVISEQPLPPELNAPLSSLNTLVLEHAS